MAHQNLDRRSLEMHRLVAEKIRRDPTLLGRAAEILARWRVGQRTPSESAPYLDTWQRLLDAGMEACLAVATEDSQHATALRQSSPLSCLLEPDERLSFLADWYGYQGKEREHWINQIVAAQVALERDEAVRHDAIYHSVDERFDISNPDLHYLICVSMDHAGRIPQDVRDRYADRVQAEAFDYIEATAAALDLSTDPVGEPLEGSPQNSEKIVR